MATSGTHPSGKCPACACRRRTQIDMRRDLPEGEQAASDEGHVTPATFTFRCEGCGATYEETEPNV